MEQLDLFERAYGGNEGIVYQTRDYKMFLYLDGNRRINDYNVRKLAADIYKKGQIHAVLITEENYVIDGQHRIAACEKMKVPVKFQYVTLNGLHPLEYVESVNTVRKNWGWREYLKMYCELGNDNYINYKKLIERFEFDHTALLAILYFKHWGGGSAGPNDFNSGNLKIKITELESIIERCENVELYWKLISRAYSNMPGKNRKRPPAKLIKAFTKIIKHDNFSHDMMVGKLKNDVSGFVGINTIDGFVGELTKIYNMRNKTNIIKFD